MEAQCYLGGLYDLGLGVPENKAEAYVWFSLSAAAGQMGAESARDEMARHLSKGALEQAQARATKLHEEIQAKTAKR